jgi:hypothetical protein
LTPAPSPQDLQRLGDSHNGETIAGDSTTPHSCPDRCGHVHVVTNTDGANERDVEHNAKRRDHTRVESKRRRSHNADPPRAAAKGLAPVDIQTTLAGGLPATGAGVLGRTVVSNTAVDYRIKGNV